MSDVLKIIAFVSAVALLLGWMVVSDTRCREAGGVYLWREAKCITGVEEIRP